MSSMHVTETVCAGGTLYVNGTSVISGDDFGRVLRRTSNAGPPCLSG